MTSEPLALAATRRRSVRREGQVGHRAARRFEFALRIERGLRPGDGYGRFSGNGEFKRTRTVDSPRI